MEVNTPTPEDYDRIARELKAGDVVPFLGAGASIGCGLLSGSALADKLLEVCSFPDRSGHSDLARVASWFAVKEGTPALFRVLRKIFGVAYRPGALHTYLASLDRLRLVVTTNYDDLIEQALVQRWSAEGKKTVRQPWVVVDRGDRDNVWIRQPPQNWGKERYGRLEKKITDAEQPIVFKMHGSLNREIPADDAYMITEEQYTDFLGRGDKMIPQMLQQMMSRKHFLFLGYGLRDWNVRVLMSKLRGTRLPGEKVVAWAVMRKADESDADARAAEKFLWQNQDVTMFEIELDEFVEQLQARR